MNDLYYTFQSTGSVNKIDAFQLFLDSKGNIITNNNLEYGVYNKIISININKLFFIKIKKIGCGDIIDFITRKTGLKSLIVYLTKGNCGCEERRIKFNKFLIPYWFEFKTRHLYDIDHKVLQKNKNIFFKKLENKKEINTLKEPNIFSQNTTLNHNQKAITHQEIKKSCGCGKKK